MLAATSSADITPPVGVIAQGHVTDVRTHSVLYPIELRTIVFAQGDRRVAIITADIVGIHRDATARIRERIEHDTKIPEDSVMFACSHTHTGPATLNIVAPPQDKAYLSKLEDTAVESVVDACGRLEPATLGLGGSAAHFNINRRPTPESNGGMAPNMAEVIDRRVRLLRVDRADGNPLALLFHYTCHPVTMASTQGYLTPDYPGVARATIESQFGCHGLFLPGCFGNIRPNLVDDRDEFIHPESDVLEDLGRQLSDAVIRATRYIRTFEADVLKSCVQDIAMPFGETYSVDELKQMAGDSGGIYRNAIALWAEGVLDLMTRDAMPESEVSQMQAMRIGPLAMITIPGEPVLEIGYAIERELVGRTNSDDVWPVGYTNDMLGYLVTERQKSEGGYEPKAFRNFKNSAGYAKEQELIVKTAVEMSSEVA
jgi:hypothetical protein